MFLFPIALPFVFSNNVLWAVLSQASVVICGFNKGIGIPLAINIIQYTGVLVSLCLFCSCSLSTGPAGPPSAPADPAEHAYCKWQERGAVPSKVYTFTVFSDYECPACQRAGRVLRSYKKEHPQRFKLSVLHYPLDINCNRAILRPLHSNACRAAEYVLCAGALDLAAQWRLHDEFLSLNSFSLSSLKNAVSDLGLDEKAISRCVQTGQARERLAADIEKGINLGIEGTPHISINGVPVRPLRSAMLERFMEILLGRTLIDCTQGRG